ncbi:MAG: alpha/beta fold hydrolase [Pirellulales bacterium]|nr:alpha/beta fold hydrolase [Pirellulales bacterium]
MSPIPNQTDFVTIAGKKIQVMRGGKGPPLVYLHSAGGEMDWTAFHNGLAEHFSVIAPAHPGFALSEGLDKIDDMQDLVWHYVDLFEQFDLCRVPVVGFSLGGWLGVELAILRPELVAKLAMVNAAGLHVPGAPMAEWFIDDLKKLRNLLFYDPESSIVAEAMPLSLDDMRILQFLRAREATARVGWSPYLHNPKLPAQLHRVQCPTLLIWGRDDQLIPLAHGREYAKLIPGARLEIIDCCGHMLPYEQPAEFVKLTTQFVQS